MGSKIRNLFISFYSLAENGFFHLILSSLTICEHPLALKVVQIDVRYKFVVEQCVLPSLFDETLGAFRFKGLSLVLSYDNIMCMVSKVFLWKSKT